MESVGVGFSGAKIAVQAALMTVDLTNAPDHIRSCLQLTRTCKVSLDRLIKTKNEHRASLKPSQLREVEEIIDLARDRIEEVHDHFEPCCKLQPDTDEFEMRTMGRVQWTLLNSADFKRLEPGIGVLNDKVEHQITRIRLRAEHEAMRSYFDRALASTSPPIPPFVVGDDQQEEHVGTEALISNVGSTIDAKVASSSRAWPPQPTPLHRLKDDKSGSPRRRLGKDGSESGFRFSHIFSSSLSPREPAAASSPSSSTDAMPPQRPAGSLGKSPRRSKRGNVVSLDSGEGDAGRDETVVIPITVPISTKGGGATADDATPPPASGRLLAASLPRSLRRNIIRLDVDGGGLSLPLPSLPQDAPPSSVLDLDRLPPLIPIPPLTLHLPGHDTDSLLP